MNSVLGKMANLMGVEFTKLKNLRKEVKFVSDELASMKDALEGLSYLDELDPQTKRWRDIVRELSYDIEEIIDDFMQNTGGTDKRNGFVGSTIRRLKTLRARHQIAQQIEDVKKLVLETSARRRRYKIDTSSSGNIAIDPRVATLYENAANLVGVEEPTNELINLLRDEEKKLKVCLKSQTSQNFSVVYYHNLGESHLFTHACESHLIDMLRKHLKNERYLIIIDDIWDVSAWDIIKCAFPENHLGSRVITTTRIQFKFLRVLVINLHRAKVDLSGLSKLYQLRVISPFARQQQHIERSGFQFLSLGTTGQGHNDKEWQGRALGAPLERT
ncbi:hypothetical protein ZWY2020_048964 [Hordeum vulgare]|nr:hypothetical protein ZWY2020_048964 [Hordeum vulgare]